jgi:hypothetical protein
MERSQLATWLDRADISAKVWRISVPSSSTIHSAGRDAVGSAAAIASNQSSAQLNSANSGQRKSRQARS